MDICTIIPLIGATAAAACGIYVGWLFAQEAVQKAKQKYNVTYTSLVQKEYEAQYKANFWEDEFHRLSTQHQVLHQTLATVNLMLTQKNDVLSQPVIAQVSEIEDDIKVEIFATAKHIPTIIDDAAQKLIISLAKEEDVHLQATSNTLQTLIQTEGIKASIDISSTEAFALKEILKDMPVHNPILDPSIWQQQALLAANGQWDALKKMQNKLVQGDEFISE